MLKYICAIILFIATVSTSYAQKIPKEKITGTVKTTDGYAAEFISISLQNTAYGTVTDANGSFELEAPAGNYTMVVHSIAAHRKEIPITIEKGIVNNFPNIEVIENKTQLDEVVVTGQFSRQSVRNSVYKVKVINSKQVQQRAATDVQSLLNTEIGIRLSNDMSLGETDFELMGMSGNNVKILIDGIPIVERGSNKQSLSQIDINTIEQIEIVEGPMSVVYGTDALAGVINIITKKGGSITDENNLSISAKIQEESIGTEYNPFADKGIHNQSINLGWTHKKGFYTNASFARNTSGGWTGDKIGREKQWQPKDQYLYSGLVGYKIGKLNIWYRLDYTDETIFTPINPIDLKPNEISDRNYLTDRYTHQLQADLKVNNKFSLNIASSYQNYERLTQTTVTDLESGNKWLSVEESAQDISKNKLGFIRTTAIWALSPKFSLQPGAEYQHNEASGDRIEGSPKISDLSAFLSAEWAAEKWLNIRPGVRSILNSDYDAPIAIPSLTTKMTLNHDMDLRLSYAYGFRSPTLRELHFSFFNANHSIIGNPDLKAEYSNNITASYTWRILHNETIRLTSTVGGFYNDFRDRITTATSEKDPTLTTYYNIDKYKTTGGSFENAVVWGNFHVSINFSLVGRSNKYSDSTRFKDQNMLAFRFSPELSSNITYKIKKTGTDLNLFYKFTGKREEYQYDSDTNELYLAGMESYNWADFTVNQKVWKYISLNAGIKNLFNVTMIRNNAGSGHNSAGSNALVGCGRSYFVGLNFLFNSNQNNNNNN